MHHISEDWSRPGYILFSDGSSIKTTNGQIVKALAGSPTITGYVNAEGSKARFNGIRSFERLNKSHLVIADFDNSCLRLLNMETSLVSDYAGSCTEPGDAVGKALEVARFRTPLYLDIGRMQTKDMLFVADTGLNLIRIVNIEAHTVGNFPFPHQLDKIKGLVLDTIDNEQLVVFSEMYIQKVKLADRLPPKIYRAESTGSRDGALHDALFEVLHTATALARNVYLLSGNGFNGLRVVDLKNGQVSSICIKASAFRKGSISNCQIDRSYGIAVVGNAVYIGGSKSMHKLSGNLQIFVINFQRVV